MKTIEIPIAWIERLQDYIDKVEDDYIQSVSVHSLIWYLKSIDSLTKIQWKQ